MRIGVIITDGGKHSPEKFAMACAGNLIAIDVESLPGPRYISAQKLQLDIAEALIAPHASAQATTRSELTADAAAHFTRTDLHDPSKYLDQAVENVQAAASGTEWESLFLVPDAVERMRQVIGQYLVDLMHSERLWHARDNPDDRSAAAYVALPSGVIVVDVGA